MLFAILALMDSEEQDTYGKMYAKYRGGMVKYARSIVKDSHLAEDVVQLSFLKLMEKAGQLERMEDYQQQAYIAATIHNTAIDMLRKKRDIPADYLEEMVSVAGKERDVDLYDMMQDSYRDAVLLKHLLGLSNREVAKVLDIGEEAAKKRVQRGTKQFQEDLRAAYEAVR